MELLTIVTLIQVTAFIACMAKRHSVDVSAVCAYGVNNFIACSKLSENSVGDEYVVGGRHGPWLSGEPPKVPAPVLQIRLETSLIRRTQLHYVAAAQLAKVDSRVTPPDVVRINLNLRSRFRDYLRVALLLASQSLQCRGGGMGMTWKSTID